MTDRSLKRPPPFTVVPMPLNKDNEGPESDISKVDRLVFEVWDANTVTVATHETRTQAEYFCNAYNENPYLLAENRDHDSIPSN